MEEAAVSTTHQHARLSDRERQILVMASKGLTDQAISQQLGISFATVGTYWGRIRGKLGPYNRTELVAKFLRSRAQHAVDQLKAQNAQLIAEIEKQSEKVQELETGAHFFEALLQSAPDAILLVDSEGFIRFANKQCENLFGYPTAKFSGMHVRRLIPDRYHQDHDAHRKEYMAHPTRRRMGEHYGTPAIKADGSEVAVVIHLNTSRLGEQHMVTCVIREQKEDEE